MRWVVLFGAQQSTKKGGRKNAENGKGKFRKNYRAVKSNDQWCTRKNLEPLGFLDLIIWPCMRY